MSLQRIVAWWHRRRLQAAVRLLTVDALRKQAAAAKAPTVANVIGQGPAADVVHTTARQGCGCGFCTGKVNVAGLRRLQPATLTARDWRSGKASAATHARNSRPLSEQLGGLLHPDFADWYQGLPAGWSRAGSASGRSGMRRFQSWLRLHSVSCSGG